MRLDPAELTALENRAVDVGIKPSVLARNLIRVGLTTRRGADVAELVDRLEGLVSELRSVVV